MRYLALGDSYTAGEGVGTRDRWPVVLAAELRRHGMPVDEPEIIARTGWTTGELTAAVEAAAPPGRYDLVSLLVGVNDQYRGGKPEEYRLAFGALLRRAVGLAGADPERVIVLSIPDWGATPFAAGRDPAPIAAAIDAFNAVNRDETIRARARYVDVTTGSRSVGRPGSEALLAPDGLHPSGRMYAEWARLVLPQALAALGSKSP